ncbi:MAG: hypothetical protein JWP65_1080 [Ramlibacter sp.]|jgi:hypothetical protein|uniref:hypothetical protein n=1 Tax=Ramlibacter sp. TaxID=1917967 RepID=UPI0026229677|nr:hypothetical protein [Ramlibacter sp.]MDB5750659.1 hypothetical protein [Ramlibacter sp.]
MKARLRSTVAAMLLLAPVAATLVAQPAAAQQQAAPAVTSMALNADAGLSPGSTLRLQVQATPYARSASVALGDSGVVVQLQPQGPGTFTGAYVVRRADRIDPLQLMTARVSDGQRTISRSFSFPPAFQALAMGGQASGSRADDRQDRREERQQRREERREARNDRSAPQITGMAPAHGERIGERGRAEVSAKLADEGSGIDKASVRLRLGGRDVTANTRVTDDEVSFRGDLDPGRYTAELTVRDHAGNMTSKSWTFDIVERQRDRVGAAPAGELPLHVTSHDNNARIDAGAAMVIQGRTAPHATVRVQVETVANVAGLLGLTQQVMDQTLQADASGNFNFAVAPGPFPIAGARYDVRLTSTRGSQTAQERLTLYRG